MSGTVVAGQTVTSQELGVPNWTPLTMSNGWGNTGAGFPDLQFRVWPLLNSVEIVGDLSAGTLADGTVVATLPNTPATQQEIPTFITSGSGTTTQIFTPRFSVHTDGTLVIKSIPTGTTGVFIKGWYSLDA